MPIISYACVKWTGFARHWDLMGFNGIQCAVIDNFVKPDSRVIVWVAGLGAT